MSSAVLVTLRFKQINCSIEVISFSMLIENNANGAINFQQLRNNMYCRSSHGSRHFVRKPKSASKVRLVRWPALLETRTSRLPTTRNAGQPIAVHALQTGSRTSYEAPLIPHPHPGIYLNTASATSRYRFWWWLRLRFDFDSTAVRREFDCSSKVIKVPVT